MKMNIIKLVIADSKVAIRSEYFFVMNSNRVLFSLFITVIKHYNIFSTCKKCAIVQVLKMGMQFLYNNRLDLSKIIEQIKTGRKKQDREKGLV